ncbi:bifunctional diguanylate cyclase/phosphodiesterase [Vogesella sp. LIG4]|uniref:bifunctional diguanylate cyclase/phosphodiesterase n=1 Tax=Vogesella sp. LIG4 TaxID=1192162 RepID=UPI0008200A12|nr:bifunctional diguanylate cyclase/phosphodiesterase [Vogesella sp. LIG4]SCK30852.1 PAS domain S-box-containing protein/diguanylate cyclase (GGDEF) domain-containing protein [Vogesella sp. LIG4]
MTSHLRSSTGPAPSPLRPVVVYALFAGLWILLSDRLAEALFDDAATLTLVSTIKGWLFVGVTSLLLYGLIRRQLALATQLTASRQAALQAQAETQRLLGEICNNSSDAIFAKDQQGRYLLFNQEAGRVTGKNPAEALGMDDSQLFPPAQAAGIRTNDRQVMTENRTHTYEETLSTTRGTVVYLATKGPLHDSQGQVCGMFGISRDITARKAQEEELRIAAIAFESQEGMMLTRPDGEIVRINHAFSTLTGYSAEEVLGKNPAMLASGRHDRAFFAQMWQQLLHTGYWQGEMWNRRKDDGLFIAWQTISAVRDEAGTISHFIGTFSDITSHREAEAEIHRLAYYDPLTQLPNRRLLQDRIQQALADSERSRHYGALIFLDLDHFKVLNDTRGHAMGDQLLLETALRLSRHVRESDTVSRLGGDEFVLLLEHLGSSPQDAALLTGQIAEKIQDMLSLPFQLGDTSFHASASLGIVLFLGHQEAPDTLLKYADMAMYQAKAAGRDTLRFFDPAMQAALEERSSMEHDLHQALERGQLQLYYQPQLDNHGQLTGAEALLRWHHPTRGLIPPGHFIPLAEESGLILPVGNWVLRNACQQLANWQQQGRPLPQLSVNVSARQFRQPDFVQQVTAALGSSCADPRQLKIELTESMVLDNIDDTMDKMQALRELGVGFSLDDFGTGSSSLSYLTRLPLDELKIDKSFILNLPHSRNDAIIAQTIIAMANGLGLQVIAEGVETRAQQDFLRDHHCNAYQGYLFSRPLPAAEFEQLRQQLTADSTQ